MMRKLGAFLVVVGMAGVSAGALGAQLIVEDPCDAQSPWLSVEEEALGFAHVGAFTISLLQQYGIPFEGSESGLSQIKDSPVGDEALELIDDRNMRAYGWCYSVNGLSPNVYADELPLGSNDVVRWYYGYATYRSGIWTTMCSPTNRSKPAFICS